MSSLTEAQYLKLMPKTIPPERLNGLRLLVETPIPASGLTLNELTLAIGEGAEHVSRAILSGGEISHVECGIGLSSDGRTRLLIVYRLRQRPPAVWLDGIKAAEE